jgi:hypothetical protein
MNKIITYTNEYIIKEYSTSQIDIIPRYNLHRNEDEPSLIVIEDDQIIYEEYIQKGKIHRLNKPAIIKYENNIIVHKEYYYMGLLHNENGYAIEQPNGYNIYYVFGIKHTEAQFNDFKFKKLITLFD